MPIPVDLLQRVQRSEHIISELLLITIENNYVTLEGLFDIAH